MCAEKIDAVKRFGMPFSPSLYDQRFGTRRLGQVTKDLLKLGIGKDVCDARVLPGPASVGSELAGPGSSVGRALDSVW